MEEVAFNRPYFRESALEAVREASASGFAAGNGPFGVKAEQILSGMHLGKPVLLTPSCSSALELAARLLDFAPGDEIIVPSYTFVTTVSSFVSNGATPVFCDINPDTLGLDVREAERLITARTKAICLVHYAGVAASPNEFVELCERHGLTLIEDNAHGIGGALRGKPLGTFGHMSTLSFHETKNLTCGEGGALVINDEKFVSRAEILRDKGTDRKKYFRGQVDKYTWVDVGSSWVMSDILAALLVDQLLDFEEIQEKRKRVWDAYNLGLRDWASVSNVGTPPSNLPHTSHMFYLLLNSASQRDEMISHLKVSGVNSVFHYQPLHQSTAGKKWVRRAQSFPVTEKVSEGLLRLPLHRGLGESDVARVLRAVTSSPILP